MRAISPSLFAGTPSANAEPHAALYKRGAHAPDEYYVIESKNPKVQGMDGAARSYVEFLYVLTSTS